MRNPSVLYVGSGFEEVFQVIDSLTTIENASVEWIVSQLSLFLNQHSIEDFLQTEKPMNDEKLAKWRDNRTTAYAKIVTCYCIMSQLFDVTVQVQRSRKQNILWETLNEPQKVFFERVVEDVLGGDQHFHLLCGGAGSGKTHVIAAIEHHLSDLGLKCRAICYMWR